MSLRRIAELEAERKYCRGGKRLQEYLQRCHSVIDDFVGEQTRAAPGARAPTKDVCAAAHLVKKSKVVHYGFTHYLNQFAAERCRRIDSVQDIASLAYVLPHKHKQSIPTLSVLGLKVLDLPVDVPSAILTAQACAKNRVLVEGLFDSVASLLRGDLRKTCAPGDLSGFPFSNVGGRPMIPPPHPPRVTAPAEKADRAGSRAGQHGGGSGAKEEPPRAVVDNRLSHQFLWACAVTGSGFDTPSQAICLDPRHLSSINVEELGATELLLTGHIAHRAACRLYSGSGGEHAASWRALCGLTQRLIRQALFLRPSFDALLALLTHTVHHPLPTALPLLAPVARLYCGVASGDRANPLDPFACIRGVKPRLTTMAAVLWRALEGFIADEGPAECERVLCGVFPVLARETARECGGAGGGQLRLLGVIRVLAGAACVLRKTRLANVLSRPVETVLQLLAAADLASVHPASFAMCSEGMRRVGLPPLEARSQPQSPPRNRRSSSGKRRDPPARDRDPSRS